MSENNDSDTSNPNVIASKEEKSSKAATFEDTRIIVSVRARPLNNRECNEIAVSRPKKGGSASPKGNKNSKSESTGTSGESLTFSNDGKTLIVFEKGVPNNFGQLSVQEIEKLIQTTSSHIFTYDHVYPTSSTQQEVFEDIGLPVLRSSFNGFNTCIFAYGQTGSGKSHTMMGPEGGMNMDRDPGIIPLLCRELFRMAEEAISANEAACEEYKQNGEGVRPPELEIQVYVSYLEIYKERVRCLLTGSNESRKGKSRKSISISASDVGSPPRENTAESAFTLRVREHPTLGVYVEGLKEVPVKDAPQVMRLILNGNQHRHTASTSMNDVSSRSHAIFALSLVQKKTSYTKDGSKKVTEKRSKINLVDLAGSERVRSTGAEGETLKEGAQINQSLSTLGLVISILADNSQAGKRARLKHVPYRDSTLTYLLKESLGGNSKTFMLSTVSPSVTQHDETLSTLRYADRAKAIVTRAFINESAGDKRIRELEDEVVRLREQIRSMENISNEQREAMLAQLMQTQRHHTSGSSSDSEEENVRQEGENPLDNLQQQLQHAEEVIRQLTATEEDRQRELRQALQADTIKLERKEPYLLNVDCVGKWIVAHFSCEETYLSGVTVEEGDEAAAEVSSPTAEDGKPLTLFIPKDANDASIGAPHCVFQLIKETGAVFLVPLGGFSTFLNYSDTPVACRTLLRNGDVLSLGAPDGAQFRFTDPTDVPLTAGGARRTLSRPMASLSRPRDPSEPTITFDSVSPQTHEGTGGGRGMSDSVESMMRKEQSNGEGNVHEVRSPIVKDKGTEPSPYSVVTHTLDSEDFQSPIQGKEVGEDSPAPRVPPLKFPTLLMHEETTPQGDAPRGDTLGSSDEEASTPSAKPTPKKRIQFNLLGDKDADLLQGNGDPLSTNLNEKKEFFNRYSFVLLGDTRSGKTSLVSNLQKDDKKWYDDFFGLASGPNLKEGDAPTFGIETTEILPAPNTQTEKKWANAEMSLKLYELGGTSCFSLLQEHLPPRRITYVLTFSLKQSRQSPISVHTFQNHIESILCQTDHKSVSIILLATHMDAAVHPKNNKAQNETATQKIVALLDQLEQQISAFIQVVQPDPNLRPTITGRFAVDNVNRSVLALGCQKVYTFPDLLVWLQEYAFHKIRQDDAFPQGLVPATVHALERHLSYLQKSGRVSLSTADYRHLAREVSQTYNASNNNLHKHTQLLYSSGAVVHRFRQISLRKQIFIDVKWLYEFLSVFSLCSYVAVAPSRRKLSSAEEAEAGVTSNRVVLLSCPDLLKSFSAVQPLFQPDFVNQKDRLGLLTKGVLTLPVLTTLVAHFTKGKGTSCQFPDLPTILDLLESFDYIIRGSKLLFSVDSQIARKDQPVMKWETFLLVPHTFTVSPPPPVVLHFSKFLSGPFYRFHFNMVPLHFFAKLMSRLSHNPLAPAEGESENVIEKVYVGPMVVKSTPMEGPLLPVGGSRKTMAANTLMDANAAQLPSGHFSLWSSAVWVVGRGGNRAFLRMLKHALFVSFHQGQSTDPNTDLFFETILSNVRSLIMESPGASCEESLLCCRYYDSLLRLPQQGLFSGGEEDHVEDITTVGESDSMFYRTVDDNINTLEKIRAREKTALHTARSRRDSSEVGEGKEEEGDIIPLLRTRNASSPPVKATVLFDVLCATTMNTVGRGAQDTIEAVVDRLNSCYQKGSDADATGEVLDDLLDAFALLDANKRVTFKGTVV